MQSKNYTRQELENKIVWNSLQTLLKWKDDLFEAILTWNKKYVDFLLAESIWEQCRIVNMKIEHIIWLGEWLDSVDYKYKK